MGAIHTLARMQKPQRPRRPQRSAVAQPFRAAGRRAGLKACAIGVFAFFVTNAAAQQTTTPARPARFDAGTISGLAARNIGSAEMSGRVAAVTALDDNGRVTVFVGAASGGVWKSVDGGSTFKPVFDAQPV